MKKLSITLCLIAFVILETSAVGLNSKAMAMKMTSSRLSELHKGELPIGLQADAYVKAEALEDANEEYYRNIQRFAILLAISFPVWDKYAYPNDYGNKISTLIPLLLTAQLPYVMLAPNANSSILNNLILGMWFGYYMNGWKDSDGSYSYKSTLSITMLGILGTLYLNELFKLQMRKILLYVTLRMGMIFETSAWEGDGQKDSEGTTKFGFFPAIGAEYMIGSFMAVFANIGYNPYGVLEFGARFNLSRH